MPDKIDGEDIEGMLDNPVMAEALQSEHLRTILDGLPVAIAASEICRDAEGERVVYANQEFERLTGRPAAELEGAAWSDIPAVGGILDALLASDDHDDDFLGTCEVPCSDATLVLDWWANVIRDGEGRPVFRIVAAAESTDSDREEAIRRIRAKETALRELQHRVGNNLQIITTLIRIEARNLPPDMPDAPFERLAGRVGALATLYRLLSEGGAAGMISAPISARSPRA